MPDLHYEIVPGERIGPYRLGMSKEEIKAISRADDQVIIEYDSEERCNRIAVLLLYTPARLTLRGQEARGLDNSAFAESFDVVPGYASLNASESGIRAIMWERGDDQPYSIEVFHPVAASKPPPEPAAEPATPGALAPAASLASGEKSIEAVGAVPTQGRVWGIKLGSGGRYVPFCERHRVVGVGWKTVDSAVVATGTRDDLWAHVKQVCGDFYSGSREVGKATGQLFRFGRECREGDYVLYYDPAPKTVRVCRVTSGPLYRDFDPDDPTDVWHCRRVEYPIAPIPVLDLHGSLKGGLLGPRMSFWELAGAYPTVDRIARGLSPGRADALDPEIGDAYRRLQELVIRRTEVFNEQDWEWLVVDYFKAQGASVDERQVGGNRPIIDAEARFDHGEFGPQLWRVQVKHYRNRVVDWPEVEHDFRKVGGAKFCFVSVSGFTVEARQRADAEGVRLLEAGDFVRFLLGGKLRERLRAKLQLPVWNS